jgi:TetR/AcrR family transcriptional repressor of nem operon
MMVVMFAFFKHDDDHAISQVKVASIKKVTGTEMRYPAAETAEKHLKILENASHLFKKRGFADVSLGEIMKATGLTHGPFYNHFASKDALITETIEHDSARALAAMDEVGAGGHMADFIEGYVGAEHRDSPEQGCLMAALSTDISREKDARQALSSHVVGTLERLVKYLPWRAKSNTRSEAAVTLAAMVGAVVLARSVDDPRLSDELLAEVRAGLKSRWRAAK